MKHIRIRKALPALLAVLSVLLLAAGCALAEEAENLSGGCAVKVVDSKHGSAKSVTDGKYTSYWESSSRKNPWITLTAKKPIYGLYLCFQKKPASWEVQEKNGSSWTTVAEGGSIPYHHVFFELDGTKSIRIISTADGKSVMGFNDIFVFGEGEVPDWVQRWNPPVEKADLLVFVTHPDDEQLFTGGAIPTYAVEKGKSVEVVYLTESNKTRRSEALNGLWAMGVRNYPEFGPFGDTYPETGLMKDSYVKAGGKQKVQEWLVGVLRKYKPDVVVTHAENGEYGHPQHKMTADAAKACVPLAADAAQFPDSAALYGAWQVKKLYLHSHESKEGQTVMDWEQPLSAFGGKTGKEVAAEGFALHITQIGKGERTKKGVIPFEVETTGPKYFYDRFDLILSTVGEDEAKNDFLEHIE